MIVYHKNIHTGSSMHAHYLVACWIESQRKLCLSLYVASLKLFRVCVYTKPPLTQDSSLEVILLSHRDMMSGKPILRKKILPWKRNIPLIPQEHTLYCTYPIVPVNISAQLYTRYTSLFTHLSLFSSTAPLIPQPNLFFPSPLASGTGDWSSGCTEHPVLHWRTGGGNEGLPLQLPAICTAPESLLCLRGHC